MVRGSRCIPGVSVLDLQYEEIKGCRNIWGLAGRSPGGRDVSPVVSMATPGEGGAALSETVSPN